MNQPTLRPLAALAAVWCLGAFAGCDDEPAAPPPVPGLRASSGAAAAAQTAAPQGVLVDAPPPNAQAPAPAAPPAPPASGEALSVAVATPTGAVRGAVRPSVTFDRPVRALGRQGADDRPPARITPAVEGEWRWLGSTTAEFSPKAPLPLATRFTVEVPAGLKALDGASLKATYRYDFETSALRPLRGEPVSRWRKYRWARPNETFKVTFDQQPAPGAVAGMVKIIGGGKTFGVTVVGEEKLADRRRREAKAQGEVPAARLEAIGKDRRVEVTLKPAEALPLGTDYTLVFPAGLGSAEGPKVSPKAEEWAFSTYGPLTVQAVECQRWHQPCASGPITLRFSNPVRAKDLKRALSITPSVKLWWPKDEEAKNETWVLGGDFKPAALYTVRVEGLVDTFAQGLAEPYTTQYTTGDFPPYVDTVENRALIEKGHRVALPVTHVNAPPVELAVTPLAGAEAVRWLTEPWRTVKGEVVDYKPLALPGAKNQRQRSPLDLSQALAGAPMALVRMRWKDGRYTQRTKTVVQVTDLAVHGKMSPNTVAVWVWSLADGSPRADAQVDLLDRDGKVVATARTAKDGTATFPGVEALPFPKTSRSGGKLYGPPTVVARVRYDGDQAMVALNGDYRLAPYRFGLNGAWENTPPRAEGLAFTDRGIYRPGETLYVRGILRERSLGRLSTPAGRAVKVKLTDPKGETVGEVDATATAFGGVTARFTLPPDGKLGDYGVQITDAERKLSWSTSARVAEYRAPSFLVDVNRAGGDLLAGQPVQATIEGRYLFGAAMGGAETSWAVTKAPAQFTPPEPKGFVFGKQVPWWASESEPDAEEVARGSWRLDAEGRHTVDGGKAAADADRPSRYTVEAGVTDVDRQVGGGRARFLVHPAAFYVGVRGPAGFAAAGEAFEAQVVARKASAKGEPVAAKGVTLKLVRHEYNTVRKKNAAGAFETVSEKAEVVAATCTTDVGAAQPGKCSLTTDKAGYHQLVAEAKDAEGRLTRTTRSLWVVGPGYAAWLRDDDNKVEVVTDRARYDVGQVAKLLVQSPYPEAEAWVTVEREGILMQKRVTLKGTATPIEIPINDAMIPNVFVGVVLARGRTEAPGKPGDPGRPSFRMGYAELKVVPDARRLAVTVKPDADRKFPGDELSVAVAVADRRGDGVESEVTVWAVDEGVLALTGYEAPDVVAALNRPRGLSVRQGSNLSFLVPQLVYGDKGTPQGGGGGGEDEGDDPHVRKRFVTTPLFVGAAKTDKAGKVTVKGKLPDNLTTFRLMAVAVDPLDRGGRGQSEVVVNKPLLARPALPRATRQGDRFAAGVVVHTTNGDQAQVTVKARVEGAAKALDAGAVRAVTVPADRGVEVRFPFEATAVGDAVLTFEVAGGGHTDAVRRTLPVKRPVALETMAIYGQTDGQATEALALPDGIRPDAGGLTLTMASSALSGLADDAEGLIQYPYGCLEQQTSRLVPLVALKGLLDEHGTRWMGDRQPAEVVAKSVKAVAAMQQPDGGFGYWPSASRSHYWATAHAVLALGVVQAGGYDLGPVDLKRALGYLHKYIDKRAPGETWKRSPAAQAFGAFVLARHGRPEAEIERRLFKQREALPLFGQALLAATMGRPGGPKAKAQALLKGLLNHAKVDADRVHFAESDRQTYAPLFSSDTRSTAMALMALLAVDPDHAFVPRVVRHLLSARRGGGYRNTQEAAYSLLALADYAKAKEAVTPDFVAQVSLAGAQLASGTFKGKSLASTATQVPTAKLGVGKGQRALSFEAKGQGTLFYGARLRYAPQAIPETPAENGLVVQRWISPEGKGGQVKAVTEGALVRVHLRVATHQQRHYVVVEDPLPAGLEPVDPSLKTSARLSGGNRGRSSTADERRVGRWYRAFNHTELRDDRVLLFADRLPPGIHEFSYLARATTAGTFARPPARAEEMYNPEVNGRSDGGRFWVHPRAEVSQR